MDKTVKKTTLADVARLAGVSSTSVSNVVNGRDGEMRSHTRQRIIQAIKKLDYTPNLAARQLKVGHASAIGIIVPSLVYPFFGYFARLVEEVALSYGYQVLLANSDRNPEREKQVAEELWGYGVRGLIFGSSLLTITHLESLIEKGLHVVAFDRTAQKGDRVRIDSVGVDNRQVTRLLCKHLLALGHRRIGFVSGPLRTVSRLGRLQGYRSTLEVAGIEPDPELIWEGVSKNYGDTTAIELGRQGAHDLLSLPNPPTAFVGINYHYAFGIYAGARDLGLQIPDDISVTGVDDSLLSDIVRPALTIVEQPMERITRLAVERLVGRLQDTCLEDHGHQLLSPKLVVRESTAALKGSLENKVV